MQQRLLATRRATVDVVAGGPGRARPAKRDLAVARRGREVAGSGGHAGAGRRTERHIVGREFILPGCPLGCFDGKSNRAGVISVIGPGSRVGRPPVIPAARIIGINPTDHIAVTGVVVEDPTGGSVQIPDDYTNILIGDSLTVGKQPARDDRIVVDRLVMTGLDRDPVVGGGHDYVVVGLHVARRLAQSGRTTIA